MCVWLVLLFLLRCNGLVFKEFFPTFVPHVGPTKSSSCTSLMHVCVLREEGKV